MAVFKVGSGPSGAGEPPSHPPRPSLADRIVRYKAGETVFQEGELGTEMYIIQSGSIEIVKRIGEKRESLGIMEKGDFFGEMAILEDMVRTADVVAVTDVELVRVNGATFDTMLKSNTEIAIRMMRKLARRLRETTRMLEEALGRKVEIDHPVVVDEEPKETHATARLVDPASGREFPLNAIGETMVGRIDPVTGIAPDIDLTGIDTSRSSSRRHAKIFVADGEYYVIEEIGTMNGTFVNGKKIPTGDPVQLRSTDEVKFGLCPLQFRLD
jgi:CRP-like cAMP-binding protein